MAKTNQVGLESHSARGLGERLIGNALRGVGHRKGEQSQTEAERLAHGAEDKTNQTHFVMGAGIPQGAFTPAARPFSKPLTEIHDGKNRT